MQVYKESVKRRREQREVKIKALLKQQGDILRRVKEFEHLEAMASRQSTEDIKKVQRVIADRIWKKMLAHHASERDLKRLETELWIDMELLARLREHRDAKFPKRKYKTTPTTTTTITTATTTTI